MSETGVAYKKISELSAATAGAGADFVVASQSNVDKKMTLAQLATFVESGAVDLVPQSIVGGDTSLGITGQAPATATSAGGAVVIAGAIGGATSGAGGVASLTGGAATAGNDVGGASPHTAGAGQGTGAGGVASVAGGASGAGATGNGGVASVTGGAALSTNGSGGAGSCVGGVATGTGTGGAVAITGGASGGASGTGGDVNIAAGAATGGTVGSVNVCNAAADKLGFFAVTAVIRPTAITQTFSTADKTHAARTAPAGGAGSGADGTTFNGAECDALVADQQDTASLLNSVIDDLQALGLLQ